MYSSPALLQPILAPIAAIENVAHRHFLFSLHAPQIASIARAGQFIHVLPRSASGHDPLLRRAFSIMAARDEQIEILFRVEGQGTAQLAEKRVGQTMDVLGPLGQPFDVSLFHVKQEDMARKLLPILLGGGVGVPPMVFLGATLKSSGHDPVMLIGARTSKELLALNNFQQIGIATQVVTDDGSAGQQGRITSLLESKLSEIAAEQEIQPVIYACGPLPMLRAVADLAARFSALCQVSLEENMPCGIGVCNGCVVAMKRDNGFESVKTEALSGSDYGRYQRICVSGPALWANEVDWEALQ